MRGEVVAFSGLFLVVSVGGCWFFLPQDAAPVLRVLAGLGLATTATVFVFANRFIGGDDFDS